MAESTAAICDVYLWQWRMSSADPQGSSEIHLSADLNYLNAEQKHKNSEEFVDMDKMGYIMSKFHNYFWQ